jgi:hypothetical protein
VGFEDGAESGGRDKNAPKDAIKAIEGLAGGIAKFLTLKSPAEEGPLSRIPDFTYVADAMRLAIPQVRTASAQLAAAAVMGGGTFALGAGASAGSASMGALAAGSAAAGAVRGGDIHTVVNITGGTFTDRKSIDDLAERVSESIMHKVRLQGGLLTQM